MASERVLVVDDDELIRDLLTDLCKGAAYQVVAAADGMEALQALEERFFHVCIVDLNLPDMDGMEVLRRAKELYPTSEIVILTGHGELDSAVEALRLGACDYLQKPIADLDLIPITISRALQRQHLARSNSRLSADLQAANSELDLRRRQQFQFINYIGHALSGALQREGVTKVLLQAILETIRCDGAGVLLLHKTSDDQPWMMIGGKKRFSLESQKAFVKAATDYLPGHLRPELEDVELEELPPSESGETIDEKPWQWIRCYMLQVRDELEGVVVVAHHNPKPAAARDQTSLAEESLGFLEILAAQGSIALANARLFARTQKLATRDGLTGLYNHHHFFELLEVEINRAERYNQELAVIMLDVDSGNGLKAINDTFGHLAGDELLRFIGEFLVSTVRRSDAVARYGGDEFVILAPQTGISKAQALAERVRQKLSETPFEIMDRKVYVTVSVGAAVFRPGQGESADTVVSLADRGLYMAKGRGGNQVCMVQVDSEA